MLRRSIPSYRKKPRNSNVAPQYDDWWKKYDAWTVMNRMSKLVGTGFYIPPEWYQHFRMFPPPHNMAREEQTHNHMANPQNQKSPYANETRMQVRQALAQHSRSAASAGNRYANLFWVMKPLDEMERSYYRYVSEFGYRHEEAVEKVVNEYYAKEATRTRVHSLHQEEARLSGKFITMKEGLAVIQALAHIQSSQMAPHEFAQMANRIEDYNTKQSSSRVVNTVTYETKTEKQPETTPATIDTPVEGTPTPAAPAVPVIETVKHTEEAEGTTLNQSLLTVRERVARKGVQSPSWSSSDLSVGSIPKPD
eukprot:PhF_6_TR6228/c1_g1_i1/m.9403